MSSRNSVKIMTKTENKTYSAIVERSLSASPEQIFNTLTGGLGWMKFLQVRDYTVLSSEGETITDGKWRMNIRYPDGSENLSYGIFNEVEPNQSIVFTWIWECDGGLSAETLVTISLLDQDNGKTAIRLVHDFLPTEAKQSIFTEIWFDTLKALQKHYTPQTNLVL